MRFLLKDVRQWRIRFELFRFGVLTLVLVLIWVGVELYSTYSETTVPESYDAQIEPLNPSLDLDIIDSLEKRVSAPEEFSVVVDDPEASASSESGVLASPSPTPISTSSGALEN